METFCAEAYIHILFKLKKSASYFGVRINCHVKSGISGTWWWFTNISITNKHLFKSVHSVSEPYCCIVKLSMFSNNATNISSHFKT